jgi:23S rRNA (guanosine2251-2'-O)-methyltransferase
VLEVFRAGRRKVFHLFLAEGVKYSHEMEELAERAGIAVQGVAREKLDEISQSANHQGAAIAVSPYSYVTEKELAAMVKEKGAAAFILVLDHLQDPQNLGSLIRTAEVAGVDAVVIPADRAVGVSPAVVRASAGATEHMRVCLAVNLVNIMKKLKDEDMWFYGLEALPDATLINKADFSGGVGLVVGSEDGGLGRLVRENCDFIVRIPARGRVGSFNAGVAGGIAVYEVVRQRSEKNRSPSQRE